MVPKQKTKRKLDSRGIEPRTTPMLREYYTTKPQAQLYISRREIMYHEPDAKLLSMPRQKMYPENMPIATVRDEHVP